MLVGAGLILLALALFALWPPARSGVILTLLIAVTGFVLLVVGSQLLLLSALPTLLGIDRAIKTERPEQGEEPYRIGECPQSQE